MAARAQMNWNLPEGPSSCWRVTMAPRAGPRVSAQRMWPVRLAVGMGFGAVGTGGLCESGGAWAWVRVVARRRIAQVRMGRMRG
jgi:hypothetical protein